MTRISLPVSSCLDETGDDAAVEDATELATLLDGLDSFKLSANHDEYFSVCPTMKFK